MASKISITTSELVTQSNRLASLSNQMDDITSKAQRALSIIEHALSSKFSSNMGNKGKTLLKNLNSLKSSLKTGSDVAKKCAESYENADKVLRDVIGDSLPDDVKNTKVSGQKVSESAYEEYVGNRTSLPTSDDGRNKGQCVGYAYCRFKYLYPQTALNSGNANQWLDNNANNSAVTVVRGGWENIKNIKVPCIAVTKGAPYNGILYGHVMVIEDITYNSDGSIKNIYFSESNGYDRNTGTLSSNGVFNPGIDGTIQKCSYNDFIKSASHEIKGFIYPNG